MDSEEENNQPKPGGAIGMFRRVMACAPTTRRKLLALLTDVFKLQDARLPLDKEELTVQLKEIYDRRRMYDSDTLAMLEGVLRISDLTIGDVLIPKSDVSCLEEGADFATAVAAVNKDHHSRYPVISPEGEIVGVLLSKDLLKHAAEPKKFKLGQAMLRPTFEPPAKTLDVLLRNFRNDRTHMVIIVDEYARFSGIVTIEDVLERIVGDIADEYDYDGAEEDIVALSDGRLRFKGQLPIRAFNERTGSKIKKSDVNTIGGWLAKKFGRLPKKQERLEAEGFEFEVADADSRRILAIIAKRKPPKPGDGADDSANGG